MQERVAQVANYLRDEFPVGRPVSILWRNEVSYKDEKGKAVQCFGEASRNGRRFEIRMSRRCCRHWVTAVDTLAHEYAHLVTWGPASIEFHAKRNDHDAAFRAVEADILGNLRYDGGLELASDYPVK